MATEEGREAGASAGLAALDALLRDPAHADALAGYHPLAATRGTFLLDAGRAHEAAAAFRTALDLCPSPAQGRLLERCLAEAMGRARR